MSVAPAMAASNYEGLARGADGSKYQATQLGAQQVVAYTATSAVTSAAIGSTLVRLNCTTDCWVEVGTSPTAVVTTSTYLAIGNVLYVLIKDTDKIAAVRNTADGTLAITVMK